jgi:hypothetical protein
MGACSLPAWPVQGGDDRSRRCTSRGHEHLSLQHDHPVVVGRERAIEFVHLDARRCRVGRACLGGEPLPADERTADRVDAAAVPRFHGAHLGVEPGPNWFPNGIGDAIHAIVDQVYGWGFCCLYVTDRYFDGFPRTWTPLPSGNVQMKMVNGARQYKLGESVLDASRIVQIDRNPGLGLHGCSALRAYAQNAWGLLAAGNQSMTVNQGGIPPAVLKSQRKLTAGQAETLQTQWMTATQRRNGAPPVLPPELDFEVLGINPSDLSLLETQEFNAKAIATAYGVPSVLLNMALQGGLTYQNPAALGEMWWRFELRNRATQIANAFSAQMLPRGQWVSFDAADTFAPITEQSPADDEQSAQDQNPSQVANASPAQQPGRLSAVGG